MKKIIVYYSMCGNTEYAAEKIAEATGADVLRIAPDKAYPDKGAKKFLWGGKSAVFGNRPKLLPYDFKAEEYDLIIFGTPVWASNITPPLRTFIFDNKDALRGKKIALFTCFSGGGADKASEKLKKLLEIQSCEAELVLVDPKDKPSEENEEKLKNFCESINGIN
ncbi:MAG: flavodoxin domain-containing protein [Clostridia bacterium]|nr:flavodoxin domain-containing protein [Clostridia bacterium]